ncbi:MAG TPA: Trp biosynthesis-associated membrane protein [Jatrophihabitantaceae bacterium]|nr:Trp biosynthesis-associated membrane protein [Jatrophihabitantaceae bacterium]
MPDRMRSRVEFATALLLDLIGGGAALLISTRHWQTVHIDREPPLPDHTLEITGRHLDNAPTAVAVVALAGVVAVIAVKGLARNVVGAALALAGVILMWRSLALLDPTSFSWVLHHYQSDPSVAVGIDTSRPSSHRVWPWLSTVSGLLIVVAGVLIAARGHTWATLSARYEAPTAATQDDDVARARRDASMWQSLDRGDDPTDQHVPEPNNPGDGTRPSDS